MSTLRVNTLQNAAGTSDPAISGAAKAWVNFNGTGTVAIRASFNVSSITDNGTGDYTVNFTNALTDADYSCSVSTGQGFIIGNTNSDSTAPTTTAQKLRITSTSANYDTSYVYFIAFR